MVNLVLYFIILGKHLLIGIIILVSLKRILSYCSQAIGLWIRSMVDQIAVFEDGIFIEVGHRVVFDVFSVNLVDFMSNFLKRSLL